MFPLYLIGIKVSVKCRMAINVQRDDDKAQMKWKFSQEAPFIAKVLQSKCFLRKIWIRMKNGVRVNGKGSRGDAGKLS